MNAERLNAIAHAIQKDFKKTNVIQIIRELVTNLENQVNQSNAPEYQQQVASLREQLRDALQTAGSNDFSPTWQQAVQELGISGLLGNILLKRVEDIFSRNLITPAAALEEMRVLADAAKSLNDAIDRLIGSYDALHIGSEDLEPGQCEIGVLIPRGFVSNKLDELGVELGKVNKILGVFEELATGTRSGFAIRTISTTDFSVFLDSSHAVCACVAVAIERLIAIYRGLLEIRKLRGELQKLGLTKKELKDVEAHAEGKMDTGIDGIVKEMMKEYRHGQDQNRNNEIAIELKMSLKRMAARIDRGFNVEVRMREIEEPIKADTDPSSLGENEESIRDFEIIQAAAKTLQFLKLDGQPILKLSDENQKDKPKD